MTEIWINECDFNPVVGEVYERIGPLGEPYFSFRKPKFDKIGSQIISCMTITYEYNKNWEYYGHYETDSYKNECYLMVRKRDYNDSIFWMRSPVQYRKITDICERLKNIPVKKFDWSYC